MCTFISVLHCRYTFTWLKLKSATQVIAIGKAVSKMGNAANH